MQNTYVLMAKFKNTRGNMKVNKSIYMEAFKTFIHDRQLQNFIDLMENSLSTTSISPKFYQTNLES